MFLSAGHFRCTTLHVAPWVYVEKEMQCRDWAMGQICPLCWVVSPLRLIAMQVHQLVGCTARRNGED
jgi:hypothetical protein